MKRTMALGALVALAGCAESPMQAKTPSAATDQQATCRAAKDPNNPLIVEWPGTSRTALSAASQRGLVVVSYSGCVMKVLQGCDAGGRYQMKSAAASPERLVIDSEDNRRAHVDPDGRAYARVGSGLGPGQGGRGLAAAHSDRNAARKERESGRPRESEVMDDRCQLLGGEPVPAVCEEAVRGLGPRGACRGAARSEGKEGLREERFGFGQAWQAPRIDDEVLSKSQKDAYQREYDRAYSPFR